MKFAENLKSLLELNEMKQADLCRLTGIQTSLMSDYTQGKKSPTISNAIAIADALDISLDELVGRKAKGDFFIVKGTDISYDDLNEDNRQKLESFYKFLKGEQEKKE